MKDFSQTGIVVMDVCDPEKSCDYYLEKETNDRFVKYLDSRLNDLKHQGAKIIEINYLIDTHPDLSVKFDLSTIDKDILYKYIEENKIKELIYVGFHYPICITESRELGSYFLTNNDYLDKVSIAIQLTRSIKEDFNVPLHKTTEKYSVWQVML